MGTGGLGAILGGVVTVAHGVDTFQATMRSVAEQKHISTMTASTAEWIAKKAGAGEGGQQFWGFVADMGVPVLGMAGPAIGKMGGKLRIFLKGTASSVKLATGKGGAATVDKLMGCKPNMPVTILEAEGTGVGARGGMGLAELEGEEGAAAVRAAQKRLALEMIEGPKCFAAGTPLLTSDGARFVEHLRPGDLVLSRSEFDPEGPLERKPVEEVFVRVALIRTIRVGGKDIRTTDEILFMFTQKAG